MVDNQTIKSFIDAQLAAWPMAAANFAALDGVEVKELDVDGMHIKVQFNPARAVSSGAKVDAASIAARKCFLCKENRPEVQTGIDWHQYTILVNPFPIFPRHLTIPDNKHVDQLIAGRIADMARLAMELDGYTVFYNGPRCGASAPDHMHFQAGNSDFLTIAEDAENAVLEELVSSECGSLSMVASLPLKFFVIDAADAQGAQSLFDILYAAMPVPDGEAEPMMNILAYATAMGVRIIVIPRKKHRPSFYGTEGEGCMMLSPASVDMGGVFITPRRVDYDAFDADTVRRVYDELCLNNEEINSIAQAI